MIKFLEEMRKFGVNVHTKLIEIIQFKLHENLSKGPNRKNSIDELNE
jgi:hypothetical protein